MTKEEYKKSFEEWYSNRLIELEFRKKFHETYELIKLNVGNFSNDDFIEILYNNFPKTCLELKNIVEESDRYKKLIDYEMYIYDKEQAELNHYDG